VNTQKVKPASAKTIALRSETRSVVCNDDISIYQCTGQGSAGICRVNLIGASSVPAAERRERHLILK